MWRTTHSFFWIACIALYVVSPYAMAKESACSLGLGVGYVQISPSVLKLTALERELAVDDHVTYSRKIHNESTAHELSADCLLSNNFGIRASYIDGLKFSVTNTITSPDFFLESPFDEIGGIEVQSLSANITREISGSATGIFLYYRWDIIPSFANVSIQGGSYYIRAKGHWKARMEHVDSGQHFTLLGDTEYQSQHVPSIAFSGNLDFSHNIGISGHYMPVPGKTTRMLFLTFTIKL